MDIIANLAAYLKHCFTLMLTCAHTRVRIVEGKTFCPDCGEGVMIRWMVLRCGECGQRRPAKYRLREVVPEEACCTFCGSRQVIRQVLPDPEFYQLRHALLYFETAEDESPWLNQVQASLRAWILDSLNVRYAELGGLPVHQPSSLSF